MHSSGPLLTVMCKTTKKNSLSFGLKFLRLCLKPQTVLGNMKEIRQDVVKLEGSENLTF